MGYWRALPGARGLKHGLLACGAWREGSSVWNSGAYRLARGALGLPHGLLARGVSRVVGGVSRAGCWRVTSGAWRVGLDAPMSSARGAWRARLDAWGCLRAAPRMSRIRLATWAHGAWRLAHGVAHRASRHEPAWMNVAQQAFRHGSAWMSVAHRASRHGGA